MVYSSASSSKEDVVSKTWITTLWLLALAATPFTNADAQGRWTPERHIEVIVPAGAGGSLDLMGRIVQQQLQEHRLAPTTSTVVNRAGGGHAVAYAFLAQRQGDPHFISITSPNLVVNHINGRLPHTYRDFTPIAVLLTESIAFAVPADSPIKTGKDLMEALRARPEAHSVALSSALGGTHHLAFGLPARAAGVDLKRLRLIAYNSSSDALAAILGGHVSVISTSSASLLPHLQSGKLRMIAVAAEKRLGAPFSDVPTWGELGYAGVFENWRAVIAPPGLTAAQTAYWEEVMRKITTTEAFTSFAAKNQLEPAFRGSAEMRQYVQRQYAELKELMAHLGLAK
jgi:putative tricarboxylic transport membrane protein